MANVVNASYFNKPTEFKLPSMPSDGDECVLLRKIDMLSLIDHKGDIPDPLTNMLFSTTTGGNITQKPVGTDPKELALFLELLNRVVIACFVAPQLTTEQNPSVESGLVYVNDIEFNDKLHVFNWATGGRLYPQASTFSEKSPSSVAVVPKGKSLRNKSSR